jgi:hypothetical protein
MSEEQDITIIGFHDENGEIIWKEFTAEEMKQFWPPDSE